MNTAPKKPVYPILLMLVVLFSGCESEPEPKSEPESERSLSFDLLDADPVNFLADERTIFINYWAIWCPPCIKEMPILAEFREKNIDRVEVYAVNFDELDTDRLRDDIETVNVKIPSLLQDPAEVLGVETPAALPATLVLRNGKIIDILAGVQTLESLNGALEASFGEPE